MDKPQMPTGLGQHPRQPDGPGLAIKSRSRRVCRMMEMVHCNRPTNRGRITPEETSPAAGRGSPDHGTTSGYPSQHRVAHYRWPCRFWQHRRSRHSRLSVDPSVRASEKYKTTGRIVTVCRHATGSTGGLSLSRPALHSFAMCRPSARTSTGRTIRVEGLVPRVPERLKVLQGSLYGNIYLRRGLHHQFKRRAVPRLATARGRALTFRLVEPPTGDHPSQPRTTASRRPCGPRKLAHADHAQPTSCGSSLLTSGLVARSRGSRHS
jgi:hypothetical protein